LGDVFAIRHGNIWLRFLETIVVKSAHQAIAHCGDEGDRKINESGANCSGNNKSHLIVLKNCGVQHFYG